jgi:hypothetical protein
MALDSERIGDHGGSHGDGDGNGGTEGSFS